MYELKNLCARNLWTETPKIWAIPCAVNLEYLSGDIKVTDTWLNNNKCKCASPMKICVPHVIVLRIHTLFPNLRLCNFLLFFKIIFMKHQTESIDKCAQCTVHTTGQEIFARRFSNYEKYCGFSLFIGCVSRFRVIAAPTNEMLKSIFMQKLIANH